MLTILSICILPWCFPDESFFKLFLRLEYLCQPIDVAVIPIPPIRGQVLDCSGQVLAGFVQIAVVNLQTLF